MDKTRNTFTNPNVLRAVVYSRSRITGKGIPGKNRQNKEAGEKSAKLTVRDRQLRKLKHRRTVIFGRILPHSRSDRSVGR